MLPAIETAARTCEACGRALPESRPSCFYCGWEPGHEDSIYGAVVPEETHRQAAKIGRFVLSTLLLTPLGATLTTAGLEEDPALLALAALCLALGPVVLLLQLARRLRGKVETRQDGIQVDGAGFLPWSALESVELRHGFAGHLHSVTDLGRLLGGGRGPSGLVGAMFGGRGVLGLLFAPLLFLYYVVLPGAALLTPWHTRVVLTRTRGDRIVLHDLESASSFVNAVQAKLGIRSQAQSHD